MKKKNFVEGLNTLNLKTGINDLKIIIEIV